MKNIIIFTSVLLLALFSSSCNDQFDPKTSFTDKYVLNCVLRVDSTYQAASLSRTYDVEEFNPLTNTTDPSVTDAEVYLLADGIKYPLKDTAITRLDTSRYKGLMHMYITRKFTPVIGQPVELYAITKDGVTLHSRIKIPNGSIYSSSRNYIDDKLSDFTISWKSTDADNIYVPRFYIKYFDRTENPIKFYRLEIPQSKDAKGNNIYPEISRTSSLAFKGKYVDEMMTKLSQMTGSENFRVVTLELEVKTFDQYLSNYVSSSTGLFDNLSIRLDEPNYSNITGGFGIFGSISSEYYTIGLEDSYIRSFGLTP